MTPPCIVYVRMYPSMRSHSFAPKRLDRFRAAWLAFTGKAIAVVEVES